MEVICEHCETKLNIPDEKLPPGQRVRFTCPKCKNKVTVEAPPAETAPPQEAGDEGAKTVPSAEDLIKESREEDGALDFFEEGEKLALVMTGETEALRETVEGLGYRYVGARDTRDGISKMRFHRFDLLILADGFDGIELGQSPILQYLNHLSMSLRRRMFLLLIGDTFRTKDQMAAFAMSANLVVNRRDLDKLKPVLEQAISENERFYKVFMDTLAELGRI